MTSSGPFQPQPHRDSVIVPLYMRLLNGNVPVPNSAKCPHLIKSMTWPYSYGRAKVRSQNLLGVYSPRLAWYAASCREWRSKISTSTNHPHKDNSLECQVAPSNCNMNVANMWHSNMMSSDEGLEASLVWCVLWRQRRILLLLWTSESYPGH